MPPASAIGAIRIAFLMLLQRGRHRRARRTRACSRRSRRSSARGRCSTRASRPRRSSATRCATRCSSRSCSRSPSRCPTASRRAGTSSSAPRSRGVDPRTGEPSVVALDLHARRPGRDARLRRLRRARLHRHARVDALARHGDVRALDAALHASTYEYLPDSAGAGRWRGGLGTTSSWRFYGEGELRRLDRRRRGERGRRSPRAGLFGGEDGGPQRRSSCTSRTARCATGARRRSSTTFPSARSAIARNGGGGGYGDPHERDPPSWCSPRCATGCSRRPRRARATASPCGHDLVGHRRGRDGAPARGGA